MSAPNSSVPEQRARFANLTEFDRSERMLTEIGLGISKEKSFAITNAQDSALWDRLVADVRAIRERGGDVDYGYRD